MSLPDSKKRKVELDANRAANKKAAKRLRTSLDNDSLLGYFEACFKAKDFKECTRLLDENDNDMIDYLNNDFINAAAHSPDFDEWVLLLKHCPDANARYHDGTGKSWSVLTQAAVDGNSRVCLLLLQHGARVNDRSQGGYARTALMYAAAAGHLDVCRVLVVEGANVNIEDVNGKTAADQAHAQNDGTVWNYLDKLMK